MNIDWLDDVLRLLLAAAFGGVIGLERTSRGRAAGFRTNLLVATGSALIMMISLHVPALIGMPPGQTGTYVRLDMSHLAAGALTGIGFLGAGVIMRVEGNIQGLTTAATIWVVAAIGLAVGAGAVVLASLATVVVLFALLVLSYLEQLVPQDYYHKLTVTFASTDPGLHRIEQTLRDQQWTILKSTFEVDRQAQKVTYHFSLRTRQPLTSDRGMLLAGELGDAIHLRWE